MIFEKNNSEETINLEEITKNKIEYLVALSAKTVGMSLESRPIKWTEVNDCDCSNVNEIVPKNNKGPKI